MKLITDIQTAMPVANKSSFCAIVKAPFGALGIGTIDNRFLRELVYLPPETALIAPSTPFLEEVAHQINRYFDDPSFVFSLPMAPAGTAFQQKVWQAISNIARGTVMTYGEVAKQIGSAPRAVGQACGANWFPLVIPCHRVTASSGGIGGFANHAQADGFHLGVKRWLLAHEGITTYA